MKKILRLILSLIHSKFSAIYSSCFALFRSDSLPLRPSVHHCCVRITREREKADIWVNSVLGLARSRIVEVDHVEALTIVNKTALADKCNCTMLGKTQTGFNRKVFCFFVFLR